MKCLVVFLLILGVYCACNTNQYDFYGICLECISSSCKTCQGTDICAECYEGMDITKNCATCIDTSKIPINRECVSCSSLGASAEVGTFFETTCICTPDDNNCCPKDKAVYLDSFRCLPCSSFLKNCGECALEKQLFLFPKCLKCATGYRPTGTKGDLTCLRRIPVNSATHLFVLGGLLISLLISL